MHPTLAKALVIVIMATAVLSFLKSAEAAECRNDFQRSQWFGKLFGEFQGRPGPYHCLVTTGKQRKAGLEVAVTCYKDRHRKRYAFSLIQGGFRLSVLPQNAQRCRINKAPIYASGYARWEIYGSNIGPGVLRLKINGPGRDVLKGRKLRRTQ